MSQILNHSAAAIAAILLTVGSLTAIVTIPPVQANVIHAPIVA